MSTSKSNWHWHDKLNFVTAELFESPKEMPDMDFGMKDDTEAKRRLALLLAEPDCKEVGTYQQVPIYAATSGGKNFIFGSTGERLIYSVTWEDRQFPGLRGKSVTQIAVWKYAVMSPPGLASHVFWKILFPKHNAIMTDNAQTRLGRDFWRDQVFIALRDNVPVYFVNLQQNEARRVKDGVDYERAAAEAYGRDDRNKHLRLLITSVSLNMPIAEQMSVSTPALL